MYTDIWKSVPFGVGEWFLRKSVKFVSMADKFGDIPREITKISFNVLAKRVSGKRVSTMFYAFNKLLKPEIEFMNWACTTWCVEKRWSFFRQKNDTNSTFSYLFYRNVVSVVSTQPKYGSTNLFSVELPFEYKSIGILAQKSIGGRVVWLEFGHGAIAVFHQSRATIKLFIKNIKQIQISQSYCSRIFKPFGDGKSAIRRITFLHAQKSS